MLKAFGKTGKKGCECISGGFYICISYGKANL